MKKLIFGLKITFLFLIALVALYIKNRAFLHQIYEAYHYDTFNVFHWQNIRFTSAEPNKNFVKTKYIIHNPKKFNAFIFGSSRVGNLPIDRLPAKLGGKELRWYNFTHSVGTPNDHFMTLNTFLKNDVSVDMVIIGFDEISMYRNADTQRKDLLRMPYQVYEENLREFLHAYLQMNTDESIKKQIDEYDESAHKAQKDLFYNWGGNKSNFSLTENPNLKRYNAGGIVWSCKDSYKDLEEIVQFCAEHKIRLILYTTPMYQTLYRNSVDGGYFDFLRKVSEKCEFYNFSSLNNFTTDPRYYFEWSHFRPALGLLVEKMLFGTEEEREQIRAEAGDELWGVKVNAGNVDVVISELRKQIDARE